MVTKKVGCKRREREEKEREILGSRKERKYGIRTGRETH